MNIGLSMRSAFEGVVRDAKGGAAHLATACLTNFEDLINALQTWGQTEHREDGTHTDVTADSVTVAADISLSGKMRLGGIVEYENLGVIPTGRLDNLTTPGIQTASVLKIRIVAAGVTLTGIDATGRRQGDLLLLINNDTIVSTPRDFTVTAGDANSISANRFIGSVASQSPWTIHGSEGMLLMYDTWQNVETSVKFTGWRVIARV